MQYLNYTVRAQYFLCHAPCTYCRRVKRGATSSNEEVRGRKGAADDDDDDDTTTWVGNSKQGVPLALTKNPVSGLLLSDLMVIVIPSMALQPQSKVSCVMCLITSSIMASLSALSVCGKTAWITTTDLASIIRFPSGTRISVVTRTLEGVLSGALEDVADLEDVRLVRSW